MIRPLYRIVAKWRKRKAKTERLKSGSGRRNGRLFLPHWVLASRSLRRLKGLWDYTLEAIVQTWQLLALCSYTFLYNIKYSTFLKNFNHTIPKLYHSRLSTSTGMSNYAGVLHNCDSWSAMDKLLSWWNWAYILILFITVFLRNGGGELSLTIPAHEILIQSQIHIHSSNLKQAIFAE